MRIPFLVRGPGVTAGAKNNQLMQSVDFLPELAGANGPSNSKQQDGKRMVNVLQG